MNPIVTKNLLAVSVDLCEKHVKDQQSHNTQHVIQELKFLQLGLECWKNVYKAINTNKIDKDDDAFYLIYDLKNQTHGVKEHVKSCPACTIALERWYNIALKTHFKNSKSCCNYCPIAQHMGGQCKNTESAWHKLHTNLSNNNKANALKNIKTLINAHKIAIKTLKEGDK